MAVGSPRAAGSRGARLSLCVAVVCRGADALDGICDMVSRPFPVAGEWVRIGVKRRLRAGDTADALVGRADMAMHEAKRLQAVGASP